MHSLIYYLHRMRSCCPTRQDGTLFSKLGRSGRSERSERSERSKEPTMSGRVAKPSPEAGFDPTCQTPRRTPLIYISSSLNRNGDGRRQLLSSVGSARGRRNRTTAPIILLPMATALQRQWLKRCSAELHEPLYVLIDSTEIDRLATWCGRFAFRPLHVHPHTTMFVLHMATLGL